jgi:drug/metabolite transporter (DMT)-like permease
MIFLVLSILSSSLIYVVFKLVERYKVFTFSAIVVNYLMACLAGFFLSNSNPFSISVFEQRWFYLALFIGIMFIVMFYLIAKSTQKAGVAVTTVAVKMSVVFPIAFSIWFDADDRFTLFKFTGIILALVAVYLTVFRKTGKSFDPRTILLPAFLFVGMGVVDSFVKYAQSAYINQELASTFSSIVFANALLVGLLVLPFNRKALTSIALPKTWVLGSLLGIANFGSIYFLLLALNHIDVNTGKQAMGSVVFGINNIGIVALSVLIGYVVYSERPSRINWLGISLTLISILILSISH